jgi:hypothetical protein
MKMKNLKMKQLDEKDEEITDALASKNWSQTFLEFEMNL